MKTDLILTYDKSREPDARILEALVSEIANCKMVVYDTKKSMDVPKIDKQTWVFIGDCSSHLQFKSKYNEYGIQIGWKGAKAWIRANPLSFLYSPNGYLRQFFSDYKRLYEKYDLEKKDKVQEGLLLKYTYLHTHNYWSFLVDLYGVAEAVAARKVRLLQYTYATLLFVDQYIKPFLTEQPKDLLSEDE